MTINMPLASVLDVPKDALYPKFDASKLVEEMILKYIHNEKLGLVSGFI
jgi:hypothetical protein